MTVGYSTAGQVNQEHETQAVEKYNFYSLITKLKLFILTKSDDQKFYLAL